MSSSEEEAPERRLVCRVMSQFALRGFAAIDNAKLAEAKNRLLTEDALRNPLAEQLETTSDRLLRAFLHHRWPENGIEHEEDEGDENEGEEDANPEYHEPGVTEEENENHDELFAQGDMFEAAIYYTIESDDDEDDLPVPSSNPDTDCSFDEDPLRGVPRPRVNAEAGHQNADETE